MSSSIITSTAQAVALNIFSNIIAQLMTSYRTNKPFVLDLVTLMQFIAFTIISCPPNILWQHFLEQEFPAYVPSRPPSDKDAEKKEVTDANKQFSVANTIKKFLLDQTIGGAVNTLLFSIGMGFLKGKSTSAVVSDCQNDFWPMTISALKLWPLVSILNFTVVPVDKRVLVGSIANVFWGIYLSLLAA